MQASGNNSINKAARKYDFRMAKSLGQNFLADEYAIEQIAEASGAGPSDLVIEIGPGFGVLTRPLAERAGKVAAVEIDEKLIPILKAELFDLDNLTIINDDILKVDINELIEELSWEGMERVRIVGNLPYYITTPILLGLLESKVPAESITVMVQKEVAERIVSPPGSRDYGVLSVSLQYYCDCIPVLDVPRDCFVPAPNVDSAVVNLRLKTAPVKADSDEEFFACVKRAFSQRRKTLGNSLAGYKGLEKDETSALLAGAGIEPSRRAETLSIEEFIALANAYGKV